MSLFQEGNPAGCLFLCDAWADPGSGESGTVSSVWEGRMGMEKLENMKWEGQYPAGAALSCPAPGLQQLGIGHL